MSFYGWKPYESVASKRAKAKRQLETMSKKGHNLEPVTVEGNKMALSWWGKAWNANLVRYSDYSNRIGRGRSYLRNGSVLDLKIEKGLITSLVQGSSTKPYEVEIKIDRISPKKLKTISRKCEKKIGSMQELLNGKFPKELEDVFMTKGDGLFPAPKEIKFNCSCPDWAHMCKHVAATLFGVGVKLDRDPSLFFKLRSVEMESLVSTVAEKQVKGLLRKKPVKSSRIMDSDDLSDVFGVDMEEKAFPEKVKSRSRGVKSGKKKK